MRALFLAFAVACAPKIDPGPAPVVEAAKPVQILELNDASGPNVYLHALIAAGSAYDPVGQEGLAALTASALAEGGAGDRSPEVLRSDLYPTGNALSVRADREWVTVKLRCHRDHVELCVEVFADALARPRFDAETVERLRDEQAYSVSDGILANEEALGEEVFHAFLYEGHPYGHPVAGRWGVLSLLDRDRVQAFYARHYVRGAVHVGIAGNYEASHLATLQSSLEALGTTLPVELSLQQPVPIEGRQLLAVDTDTPVTGFHFGHPLSVDRTHADYPALVLAMTAFGAHRQSSGRLFRRMRTARGLNYGDYAYAEPFVQRGWSTLPEQGALRRQPHFYVWIRPTSVENGPFALKFALSELDALVSEGLDVQEFEDTQRYLLGKLPLWAQDPGRRLAYALDAAATATPDGIEGLRAQVQALTLDDVNNALERHIRPDTLKIVAVSGEAQALKNTLIEGSETPIVYADVTPNPAQAEQDAQVAKRNLELSGANAVEAQGIFR